MIVVTTYNKQHNKQQCRHSKQIYAL